MNPEDHGEWLSLRVPTDHGEIPVRISREAMEDHFGAERELGGQALAKAYWAHEAAIHSAVRRRAHSGQTYTREAPMVMTSADFGGSTG